MEGIEVVVLRAGSREPVPGARVHRWVPPGRSAAEHLEAFDRAFHSCTLDSRLAAEAQLETSDPEGRASFTRAPRGGFIVAEAPGLFGALQCLPGDRRPLRVEITRSFDLRVRVTDGSGCPARGAGVGLYSRWKGEPKSFHRATTDSDGIATLRHIPRALQSCVLEGSLSTALHEPFEDADEVPFSRDDPPRELLELRLPAHGSCRVLVLDPSGLPHAGPVDVELKPCLARPEMSSCARSHRTLATCALREHVEGGDVLFEHVGLGGNLVAAVRLGCGERHEAVGPGPTSAGERVSLVVHLGSKIPILSGTLVDERTRPLIHTALRVWFGLDKGYHFLQGRSLTDEQGRFILSLLPHEAPEQEHILSLRAYDDLGIELGAAAYRIPSLPRAGLHELGVLVLHRHPFLAAGRVVDSRGTPVQGADVFVHRRERHATLALWSLLPERCARSDADGSFEVRAQHGADDLGLHAQCDDRQSDRMEFQPGAQSIDLVLREGGEMTGRLMLHPSVPARRVKVVAVNREKEGERPEGLLRDIELDQEGHFAIRGLEPGTYDVIVQGQDFAHPELARVDSVLVRAGAQAPDPRLDPLDMSHLRGFELTVVDEDSVRIEVGSAHVHWRTADGPCHLATELSAGEVFVLAEGTPAEVTLAGKGVLSRRLVVTGDCLVVLRNAPTVRFRLAPESGRPEPGLVLGLWLGASSGEVPPGAWIDEPIHFDPSGEALATPRQLGELRIALFLARDQRRTRRLVRLEERQDRLVQISEDSDQVIGVSIEPEALASAARRLAERR